MGFRLGVSMLQPLGLFPYQCHFGRGSPLKQTARWRWSRLSNLMLVPRKQQAPSLLSRLTTKPTSLSGQTLRTDLEIFVLPPLFSKRYCSPPSPFSGSYRGISGREMSADRVVVQLYPDSCRLQCPLFSSVMCSSRWDFSLFTSLFTPFFTN